VRANADGSLDTGFGSSGMVVVSYSDYPTASLTSVQSLASGATVVAGNTLLPGAVDTFNLSFVARYDATGAVDSGFGTNGRFLVDNSGDTLCMEDFDIGGGNYINYTGGRILASTVFEERKLYLGGFACRDQNIDFNLLALWL
jgi:hypothetical protein